MADRSIKVVLAAEVASYARSMQEAAQATEQVAKSAEDLGGRSSGALSNLAQSARDNRSEWQTVGGVLAGAGGAITALGAAAINTGIQYNTLQQTTSAALTTMLGDVEAVNAQMAEFNAFASESPYARQTWLSAQQQLLGFGVEAERVIPILAGVQDAVAAMGGGNQEIESVVYALAQMEAQGRLTGQTLNQVGQYGIDMASIIAAQTGRSGEEIRKMAMSPGGIPVDQIWDPLLTGLQQNFGGAAEGLRDTFEGAMDRVRAVWRDIGAMLAEPLVSADGGGMLVGLANTVADLGRAFLGLPQPIQTAVAALGGIAGVAGVAAGGFLLLAPRAIAAWDALGSMGSVGIAAQTGLRGVATAAGRLAPALAAVTAAVIGLNAVGGYAMRFVEASQVSFDELSRSVENLGRTSTGALDLFEDMNTLLGGPIIDSPERFAGGLERIASAMSGTGIESMNRSLGNFFGLWESTPQGRLEGRMADISAALTEMAQTDLSGALDSFHSLWALTDFSTDGFDNLMAVMPEFRSHLEGVAEAAGLTADSATLMGIATGAIVPEIEGATGAMEDMDPAAQAAAEALESLYAAGVLAAQGFMDLGNAFDEGWSPESVLQHILDQTEALEKYGDNIQELGDRLSDVDAAPLFEYLDSLDPATAAAYADALTDMDDSHIRAVVDALSAADDEAAAFGETVAGVKSDASNIEVNVDVDPARRAIEEDLLGQSYEVEVEVQADVDPTRRSIEEQLLGHPVTVPVDVDPTLAIQTFDATTVTWESVTTETLLDLDPSQSIRVFDHTTGEWEMTTTATLLAMDPEEANRRFGITTSHWEATTTTTNLDADDSRARATVTSLGGWASRQNITVPITGRLAGIVTSGSASFGDGGYTGNAPVNQIAGVVHGQEYVINAAATARHRSLLEAINSGTPLTVPAVPVGAQATRVANTQPSPPAPGPSAADIRSALDGVRVHLTGTENLADGVAGTLLTEMRAH